MSPIPSRQLGKDGPLVPRIGFGAMGLSMSYGKPMPDEQRLGLLDHAHSIGETFWDTSDFYVSSCPYINQHQVEMPAHAYIQD